MSDYSQYMNASGFVSPDERPICGLRNGVGLNFLSGEGWQEEGAVLTNKRLYYSTREGLISTNKKEEIIDIKDITSVWIRKNSPYGCFIGGLILVVLDLLIKDFIQDIFWSIFFFGDFFDDDMVAFRITVYIVLSVVSFIIRRKNHLVISFPTGSLKFSLKLYPYKNVREFIRCIMKAKEDLK